MNGTEHAVRVPLSPAERVERARRELLAKHERQRVRYAATAARQGRVRALRPITRRLKREGLTGSAATVELLAKDGAVIQYGRTDAEERALLRRVLNCLGALVGSYTPAESEALFLLLKTIDAWSEPEPTN